MDAASCAHYQGKLWATGACVQALRTQTLRRCRGNRPWRCSKYLRKGFAIAPSAQPWYLCLADWPAADQHALAEALQRCDEVERETRRAAQLADPSATLEQLRAALEWDRTLPVDDAPDTAYRALLEIEPLTSSDYDHGAKVSWYDDPLQSHGSIEVRMTLPPMRAFVTNGYLLQWLPERSTPLHAIQLQALLLRAQLCDCCLLYDQSGAADWSAGAEALFAGDAFLGLDCCPPDDAALRIELALDRRPSKEPRCVRLHLISPVERVQEHALQGHALALRAWPAVQRHVDWRALDKETIKGLLSVSTSKNKYGNLVYSFRFDLDAWCAATGAKARSVALHDNRLALLLPRMPAPGKPMRFEKNESHERSRLLLICNQEPEVLRFEQWFRDVWTEALVDLLCDHVPLKSSSCLKRLLIKSMLTGFYVGADADRGLRASFRPRCGKYVPLYRGAEQVPWRAWREWTPWGRLQVGAHFSHVLLCGSRLYQVWYADRIHF
jgi:hypothetical protein